MRRPRLAVILALSLLLLGAVGVFEGSALTAAHPGLVHRLRSHFFPPSSPSQPAHTSIGNLDDVVVSIDSQSAGTVISPLIYGVSMADGPTVRALGATVDRWGGNQSTEYNWVSGAWNAGRDWEFRNTGNGQSGGPTASDRFIAAAIAAGAVPLVTVPTIGWVARNADNHTQSLNVPNQGGPPIAPGSTAIRGYDPRANQRLTVVPSQARKPGPFSDPPDPRAPVVYQDEWVHYLVDRFGKDSAAGGFYFAMDNEPDLWSVTHTDVHPVQMSYDAMLNTFERYADAVRAQDPGARILGPDSWGWTGYFYSDLDRGTDNFATHADRRAHGDMPFLPWWLGQLARYDAARGSRSLDYLDVHFYPQAAAVFSNASDPATQALRIRSTRALSDPTYVDESWIGDTVMLIPRLKQWIRDQYPGTKLAITEYNWGAERDASGAVALAEILGIMGREGVDLATYWSYPPLDSPTAAAFELYRNFDGHGATFGDRSLPVTSSQPGVKAFAARHTANGELDVIVVNEAIDRSATIRLDLGLGSTFRGDEFSVRGGSSRIVHQDLGSTGDSLTLSPLSVSLIRLRPAP